MGELDNREPNFAEVRQILRDIESDSYRVEATISSTRALFKDDVSIRSPTHLPDLVRQALALIQHDLETNHIMLETEFEDRIPLVLIDRMQIQQVLLNLLRNSVDALGKRRGYTRVLCVATKVDGNLAVRVSVEDNGAGISRQIRSGFSMPSLQRKLAEWVWDCPFAERSSRGMLENWSW